MSTITTRAGKGSPLTNNEVDANFTNLNTDKAELSGAAFTGAITTTSTVDGRDVATDGSKLDGIEASADVTDTTNVTAAGALMDSEVTNLAQVKAFDSSDYATAAQGTTADAALPKSGGAMTGAITTNSTFDGRDVATDGTKLDGIEALADVTDTANVTAAGALMDSELTSIASVKALNQGVATTDSPTFVDVTATSLDISGNIDVDGTTNLDVVDIDGAVDMASTLAVAGVVTANAGVTVGGNVDFGDLDMARFGVGNDLQIFHNGTDNYIKNATSDQDLLIQGNDGGNIIDALIFDMSAAGAATFNSTIASAGVTSSNSITMTAGNMSLNSTSDGNQAFRYYRADGTLVVQQYPYNNRFNVQTYNNQGLRLKSDGSGQIELEGNVVINEDSANVDFRVESNNNANMLFVDGGTNRVGVGTASPSSQLHISSTGATTATIEAGGGGDAVLDIKAAEASGGESIIRFSDSVSGVGFITYAQNDGGSDYMRFGTASTERMRIDSSGNVGIGISSPSTRLEVGGGGGSETIKVSAGAGWADVRLHSDATNGGSIYFNDGADAGQLFYYHVDDSMRFHTATAERMRIDASGNLTTRQSTGNNFRVIRNGDNSVEVGNYNATDGYQNTAYISSTHTFYAGTAGAGGASRAVDIDSSGNVIVGTTNLAPVSNNVQGVSIRSFGELQSSRDGAATLYLNRKTNDGDIVILRKDGADVGSIGSRATGQGVTFNSQAADGVLQNAASDSYGWNTAYFYPRLDNAKDLGFASLRWDDVYATNGTIQTSDRNEKQDIAELSDAEQRVAVAAKGLLRKFRWKDSVAEKGDEARTHFGIIAQDLQAAFEAEGLDAGDYAMFISTTWTDEETNEEKTRMGVRYSELLAFIISAI